MSTAIEGLDRPTIQSSAASRAAERKFPLVQALRALAALAVAFLHTAYDGLTMTPGAHGLGFIMSSPGGAVSTCFLSSPASSLPGHRARSSAVPVGRANFWQGGWRASYRFTG